MATNLVVRVNKQDASASYATQPTYYIDVDIVADRLIWTQGSAEVYNHCGYSPSSTQLNQAATIIQSSNVEISKCFLDDVSSVDKLFQVIGANSSDNQHVFCFSFDAATATEPTLEAWDDDSHTTILKHVLGHGTPADSMVHAICTTDSGPGASWEGTHLAGANTVSLNAGGGALSGAKDLYANIYIRIPADYATPEVSQPVITVRFTYS